jgi:hypothetical protein
LNILQRWLSEPLCPRPATLSYYAARGGSISVLEWLRAESWCVFDRNTCAGAAFGGQLPALQFLRNEGCDWEGEYMASYAAGSGSVESVEWLRQQQGVVIDDGALSVAASHGQTGMCEYLRSIGCEWTQRTCDLVAMFGHLDTLRWLRGNGCPWNVREVCTGAACCGSTDMLEYLIEQGEVLDAELLTEALNCTGPGSKLQAAQWLRQHGAQWPAVLTCHVPPGTRQQWSDDMIAWARAQGCTAPIAQ